MSLATSSFLRTIIKAVESHLGQRLPRFRRGTVVGQSGNPLKVLVSPSGEQGVADGFEYPVLRSYTSVTVDDPGGPHEGDDLLILETTPNNPVLLGQLLTGPNDKANRDSYPGIDKVSITQNAAKKLRAHAITISHVPPIDADVPANARDGMPVVSTYDNSLWVRSSGVWERISLPVGGTTGQALAKVSSTDYDVSWQTISGGGGGGGGGGAGINATLYSFDDIDLGFSEVDFVIPWLLANTDTGSFWSGIHPSRLTIPTDGRYIVTGQVTFKTAHVSDPPGDPYDGKVKIWKNGNPISPIGLTEVEAIGWCAFGDPDDRITVSINKTFDLVAGDYLELVTSAESAISPWAVDKFSWFTIEQVSGAGPGWAAGVAMLATDEFHTVVSGDILGGFASGLMTWKTPPSGNLDFDTGSYFDAAFPRRLTIQTDGIYEISGQIEFRTDSGAGSFKGIVELWKTGAAMVLPDLIVDAMGMSNPVANGDMTVNISIPLQCVATDYFELAWFTTPGVAGQKINGSSSWFSIKRIG